jgi:hypothetical protein
MGGKLEVQVFKKNNFIATIALTLFRPLCLHGMQPCTQGTIPYTYRRCITTDEVTILCVNLSYRIRILFYNFREFFWVMKCLFSTKVD